MFDFLQYILVGLLVLASLAIFSSITTRLWIPALILTAGLGLHFAGELLKGMQFNLQLLGQNTTSALNMSVDAAEFQLLKADVQELNSKLFGTASSPGSRLSKVVTMLQDVHRIDAKLEEVRAAHRLLERDDNNLLEEFLLRQQQRNEELANVSVARVLELVSKEAFWQRLGPLLREAGLVPEVDAETQIRAEAERARVQEKLRIEAGVAEKVEQIRTQGWVAVYEAMAADFDRALPYRAGVFFLVCVGLAALSLAYHFLKRRLRVPPLVDETSASWLPRRHQRPAADDAHALLERVFERADKRPKVVLDSSVRQMLEDMALIAARAAERKSGLALPNAVFFGPPGTGKSLAARRLAEACGMDYAIMAGGNVLGLQEEAVPELRRVFRWAQRSPRGVLLFVDEAEAFLARRGHGNFHLQAAVSYFLTETGTSSTCLQLILATNRVEDLDEAVLSRLPFQIEFGKPTAELLQQQFDDRLGRLAKEVAPEAAERLRALLETRGGVPSQQGETLASLKFTGRDVQSLFEEFQRRWSLEVATARQRKADQDWLERWLQHRSASR